MTRVFFASCPEARSTPTLTSALQETSSSSTLRYLFGSHPTTYETIG